jgi:hypothetical protein
MHLTLSESPEVRSRQAATIEIRAAAVEARSRTGRDVDGLIRGRARTREATRPSTDIVEEWGLQSFPASDPPTNR